MTVRGLTEHVTKDDVSTAFTDFGEVSAVVWKLDDHGEQTGVAFVVFQAQEKAQKALDAKTKQSWMISSLDISPSELEELKKDQEMEKQLMEMLKAFSPAGKQRTWKQIMKTEHAAAVPSIKEEVSSPSHIKTEPTAATTSHLKDVSVRNKVPKLPIFSGEKKKDSSFARWQFQVKVLKRVYDEDTILDSIHQSLKSPAADVLVNMGEILSVDAILGKFRTRYGSVLSIDALREKLYSLKQDGEEITKWAFNIEEVVYLLEEKGGVKHEEVENMVKSRFWYGLTDSRIREATRGTYQGMNFDDLLVECRTLEAEYSATPAPAPAKVHQQTSLESKMDELLKLYKQLNTRMEKVESTPQQKHTASTSPQPSVDTQKEKRPARCTKCKKTGHLYFGCRKDDPEIICRRCKEPGHLANCCRNPLNS